MSKNKTFCGKCNTAIGRSHYSVLCKAGCLKWFHQKCTNLSSDEVKNIGKSKTKWACENCLSDRFDDSSDEDAVAVKQDLVQELENVNAVVKTLNEDLLNAHEEIKKLRKHNSQLEILVIEKQETIELLDRKVNASCSSCFPSLSQSSHFSTVNKKYKPKSSRKSTEVLNDKGHSFVGTNRFEVLADKEEPEVCKRMQPAEEKSYSKFLVCADSHGRGLAWHLNQEKTTHEAVGFVRPGGRSEQVLSMYNIEKENLQQNDVLVVISGTNDVAVNEAPEAIKIISAVVEKISKKSKVVLVELPNRYDLAEWSCVNKEVRNTNSILKDLSDKNPNVALVKTSEAGRIMHNRHGMHLNERGKKWLTEKIKNAVKSLTTDFAPAIDNSFSSPSSEVQHLDSNSNRNIESGNLSALQELQLPPETQDTDNKD